jgi:hypothetical protein
MPAPHRGVEFLQNALRHRSPLDPADDILGDDAFYSSHRASFASAEETGESLAPRDEVISAW